MNNSTSDKRPDFAQAGFQTTCNKTLALILTICALFCHENAWSQKKKDSKSQHKESKTQDIDGKEKARNIISFLQYILNTIGSKETPVREKDIVITQSFSKIFRDGKVQIEDDLDTKRTVITNKDVVAYLKDVDFFFEDVKFDFVIEDIASSTLTNGDEFFKVTLTRNLSGVSSQGQKINNAQRRYVEINYDPDTDDLKIVSMYTKEPDQRQAMLTWWKSLSYEWKNILMAKGGIEGDSASLNDIKDIMAIQELDLSTNSFIQNLEPVAQLYDLKKLNISETQIEDLTPIRNLTELTTLDISRTRIFDLSPLRFASKLRSLMINYTLINDLAVLENMPQLRSLEMKAVPVYDFSPISKIAQLEELNVASTQMPYLLPLENLANIKHLNIMGTLVQDLNPIKNAKRLQMLIMDSTRIFNLEPLSAVDSLQVLQANVTRISSLTALKELPLLERIYCDQTPITQATADSFMAENPDVLVVFDSKDLESWWSNLSKSWQKALLSSSKLKLSASDIPSKESLAKITNLDSVNLNGDKSINDLEPLRKLQKLRILRANGTGITSLAPLSDHQQIILLDISDTEVNDLFIVRQFKKIKELRADRSKIENIDPLIGLSNIQRAYVDQTFIQDNHALDFLEKQPSTLLVYKTSHLRRWWSSLSESWRKVFFTTAGGDTLSRESLHKLVERKELEVRDVAIDDLSALNEFIQLRSLKISGTPIRSFPALENLKTITTLQLNRSPLTDIEFIGRLDQIQHLDLSNTPTDDLKLLGGLSTLQSLNCSGTQIKKLDPVERLVSLEILDCSNTKVRNLNAVAGLNLKELRCYNTGISLKKIEKFIEDNPQCRVVYY